MGSTHIMGAGERVTREQLDQIVLPARTRTYNPMAYADIADTVQSALDALVPREFEFVDRAFLIAKDGAHWFARWDYNVPGTNAQVWSLIARNSLDKTFAASIAGGTSVIVCSNLCFDGSDFRSVRKNTTNAWADLRTIAYDSVANALDQTARSLARETYLTGIELTDRRAYAMLGIAIGEGALKPQQATIAFREWNDPTFEEFEGRTAWSLYNGMTHAIKKGSQAGLLSRANGVSAFAQRAFGSAPVIDAAFSAV